MFKYSLGDLLRDGITGFEGIVMARVEYFTGCIQYGIQPATLDKDGKMPDWEWLDEGRLSPGHSSKSLKKGVAGGPMPATPQKN